MLIEIGLLGAPRSSPVYPAAEKWRRRRESNPCTGLCRPLPKPLGHSAVGASSPAATSAASPRLRADDGIRTRDPHLGKVMLYQLSHVRMLVRGYLGPLTGSLRPCVEESIRSWRKHQLGAGDGAKIPHPERTELTPSPSSSQVSVVDRRRNDSFRADPGHPPLRVRESPRRSLARTGRGGAPVAPREAEGFCGGGGKGGWFPGPLRGPRPGGEGG